MGATLAIRHPYLGGEADIVERRDPKRETLEAFTARMSARLKAREIDAVQYRWTVDTAMGEALANGEITLEQFTPSKSSGDAKAAQDERTRALPATLDPIRGGTDDRTQTDRLLRWFRCEDATSGYALVPDVGAKAACYARNALVVGGGLLAYVALLWTLKQVGD